MSNALSPRRGKLARPAICKPSPPPPMPPFAPEMFWASAIPSPTTGLCAPFLIAARAWSHLAPHDAPVEVTAAPIAWGTLTPLSPILRNDNQRRILYKLTNVTHGNHDLLLSFTWAKGTASEHTYPVTVQIKQNCPPAVLVTIAPRVRNLASTPVVDWLIEAWRPDRPTTDTWQLRLVVAPNGYLVNAGVTYNRPGLVQRGSFPIPYAATYAARLRTWWPSDADPDAIHTDDEVEIDLPAQVGYVHGVWLPYSGDPSDTLRLWGVTYDHTNASGSPVILTFDPPTGTWEPFGASVPNLSGYRWIGKWVGTPADHPHIRLDAVWQDSYANHWEGPFWPSNA